MERLWSDLIEFEVVRLWMKRARLTMDVAISSTSLELDTGHRKVSSARPNLPFDNLILRQRFLVLPRDVVSLIHETEPVRW
jgi:hypothetical protein